MKAKEIFQRSLALLSEDTDITSDEVASFASYALHFINLLLCELFELNSVVTKQAFAGNDEQIPHITSLEDSITYCPQIAGCIMPLGLAFYLIMTEDKERAGVFYQLYTTEKNRLKERYKHIKRHRIKNMYS